MSKRYGSSLVGLMSCLLLSTQAIGDEREPIELKVNIISATCNYITRVVQCRATFKLVDGSQILANQRDWFDESDYVTVKLLDGLQGLAELEPAVSESEGKNRSHVEYRFDESQVWTVIIPYRSSSYPYKWHLTNQSRETLAIRPTGISPYSLDQEVSKYLRSR